MNIFLARQPIFDVKGNVVAYELLFRSSNENCYSGTDGNSATIDVISNTFFSIGIEEVTGGKKAFINFTEELLTREIATLLPPDILTVEILETVEPTKEVILACKSLKEKGYTLALDDFVLKEKFMSLVNLSDIIKIDFMITKGLYRKEVIEKLKDKNIKFLAEKVETVEEFETAKRYGYTYFQGYYFSKPKIIEGKEIPKNKMAILKLMEHLNKGEFDYDYVAQLVMKDVSTSYKLLKYINSSFFSLKNEVKSIKNAITLLGREEFVKWIYLTVLGNLNEDKPDELINLSLIRAKFCENIQMAIDEDVKKQCEAYIIGLVSLIDCILNVSIEKVVTELALPAEISKALNGEENEYRSILGTVISYERNDMKKVMEYAKTISLDLKTIAKAYMEALLWTNNA